MMTNHRVVFSFFRMAKPVFSVKMGYSSSKPHVYVSAILEEKTTPWQLVRDAVDDYADGKSSSVAVP